MTDSTPQSGISHARLCRGGRTLARPVFLRALIAVFVLVLAAIVAVVPGAGQSALAQELTGQPASVNSMRSLFFTDEQHQLIQDARKGFLTSLPPVIRESVEEEEEEEIDPGLRELFLSGIVYVSEKEWTVWMNGMRVTPTALPEEILDLKVYKDYVDLQWYDAYTDQIFPIRLRPHQRFNLDAKMFLPG